MDTQTSEAVELGLLAAEAFAAAARHMARHGCRPFVPYDSSRQDHAFGVAGTIRCATQSGGPHGAEADHAVELFARFLRETNRTAAQGKPATVIAAWELALKDATANYALEPVMSALYAAADTVSRRVAVVVHAPSRIGRELSAACLQPEWDREDTGGQPEEEDHDDGTPTPEWIQLSQDIAEAHARRIGELRILIDRIRHADPAVEAARIEAVTAGMSPANWDEWFFLEVEGAIGREYADTAEGVRQAAAAAAPVIARD